MRSNFRNFLSVACCVLAVQSARAEERSFDLSADKHLIESGFLNYLLPRFALKHGVRIRVVNAEDSVAAALHPDPPGIEVFQTDTQVWHLETRGNSTAIAQFSKWMTSDIGVRTLEAFTGAEGQKFSRVLVQELPQIAADFSGNAVRGLATSGSHCARCHVVSAESRMTGIGSTPSFFALRGFGDWQQRFLGFYALNPHPSFTRIAGLNNGILPEHRAAIVPLELTLEQLDDILAYVATLPAADLGAPIQHQ